MATVESVEYAKVNSSPPTLQDIALWGGNVHAKCATYEASALAADDVIQMIDVKDGDVVMEVILAVDDLGTGMTMDVGDGGNVDRYIDGADTSAATFFRMGSAGTEIGGMGYQYTADDTIDCLNLGTAATGTIVLTVFYCPVGG